MRVFGLIDGLEGVEENMKTNTTLSSNNIIMNNRRTQLLRTFNTNPSWIILQPYWIHGKGMKL